MKFLFLVTFLFSSASGATSERALQRNDFNNDPVAACNGFLKRLSSPAVSTATCCEKSTVARNKGKRSFVLHAADTFRAFYQLVEIKSHTVAL